MDDDQRPEWENLDANQVVEEIKREEFHSNLPQDKRTIFGNKYIEKENKGINYDSQPRNDNAALLKGQSGQSGVDFSKVSFDNEAGGSYNDDFNVQQTDMYANGGRSPQRNVQGNLYSQLQNNPNYNPADIQQYGAQRGTQGLQQINTQYGNKSYAQQAQSPSYAREVQATSPMIKQTANAAPNCIFKYFSPDYDKKLWSYVDLEQKVQGPYSGRTMDEWYSKGYLPPNLHVTIGSNNGFKSLKDLADVISNHYTQNESNVLKEQVQQKTPTSLQEQQYQQYQQQQQQSQYYQQQQQHPQQYHQQQQQQQQQQHPQQSVPNIAELMRSHPEYANYAPQLQAYLANKAKNFEPGEQTSSYYQAQQQTNPTQYTPQNQAYAGYNRSTTTPEPQNANYYGGNYGYYNQEPQQKATPNYNAYTKTSPTTAQNPTPYYQDPNNAYKAGYNQPAYAQPQKTQWKGGYQAGATGYPGTGQVGAQPINQGVNAQSYGNTGGNAMYQGSMATSGGGGNNMMYGMQQQQQQQQMGNRSINMGMNQNPSGDVSGYLKNMLGVPRSASRQGEADM